MVNKEKNCFKKLTGIFLVLFFSLLLISSVYGSENINMADNLVVSTSNDAIYYISSDLPNDDVQSMFDNAVDGTTFEFTDKNYKDVSYVINKKVNIISNVGSTIHVSDILTSKAQEQGFTQTAGFYFTPNSSGSLLSGFTIIPSNGYGVYLEGSNGTTIDNNVIVGGEDGLLVNNSKDVIISNNNISKAHNNGVQIQNSDKTTVINNTIYNNQRSGIELNSASNSNISYNDIHHNIFNGITLYGRTNGNVLTHNTVYENLNGVYIDSLSTGDKITANTIHSNRKNPSSELGGFETGNGILIGPTYKTIGIKVEISYNYLAHNENFQVKNNPLQEQMKIEPNYYDSNDDSDTFICPMLLGKILNFNVVSVPNGIGLQIYEDNDSVKDLGTFDTKVIIDGNEYTATVKNGKAVINVDRSTSHHVEIKVGDKTYSYDIPAEDTSEGKDDNVNDDNTGGDSSSGDSSGDNQHSTNSTSQTDSFKNSSSNSNYDGNGNSENTVDQSNSKSDSNSGVSTSIDVIDSQASSRGVNTSNIYREDSSATQGDNEVAKGEEASASTSSSGAGSPSKSGKSYELSQAQKISKSITDNSAIIIIAIALLVILFAVGYKRKNNLN